MKIGFFVNAMETEEAGYTTTRLAMSAHNMGHEVWHICVDDFAYNPDEKIYAFGHSVNSSAKARKNYRSNKSFFEDLTDKSRKPEKICVDELDLLMLRNNPADDAVDRPWAQSVGIIFGQLATRKGVIVVNDPVGLANAANKMYFQLFPEVIRPRTLITRNYDEIRHFVADQGGQVVIKPLQGSGGQSVFLVRSEDHGNMTQMIDAVSRDGYVIAQEYLPAAAEGDVRMFLMNGMPLMRDGKYAAFRRVSQSGDMRSNLHAGGVIRAANVTDDMLRIADIVRPKLVQDGMFLVGLDIAGDKLMEINVFSPGGLGSAEKLTGVNFTEVVVEALSAKVEYMRHYGRNFDNAEMAML